MWLNNSQISDSAILSYRESLLKTCPTYVVIDNLFEESKLDQVVALLHQTDNWQTQRHSYSALYVDDKQWLNTRSDQRFVQRDIWLRKSHNSNTATGSIAHDFLSYLRGEEFMSLLSRIFNVRITDMNVEDPELNTNYFRLGREDFVEQHADDSPGREICMLVYLNKDWAKDAGGELVFMGGHKPPSRIAPLFNRCVLFDPNSKGSEHWVERLNSRNTGEYRYNVTAWYWSE